MADKFITIYGTEDGRAEIVNTKFIENVFMVLPEKTEIQINWRSGEYLHKWREQFCDRHRAASRFCEIAQQLTGECPVYYLCQKPYFDPSESTDVKEKEEA